MSTSPFTTPDPQNADGFYGTNTSGYVSADYPQDYQAPGAAGATADSYQQPGYHSQAYQQPGYHTQAYQHPAAGYGPPYAMYYNQKSKVAAGLLGIFLGVFGAHNFYLGYTGKAVAQLLMAVLSFGILAPVSAIWGLIEGIIILTATPGAQPWGVDAEGLPLTN